MKFFTYLINFTPDIISDINNLYWNNSGKTPALQEMQNIDKYQLIIGYGFR